MGGQIVAHGADVEIVNITYSGLEELKGLFIRAAIRYLSELSSQNISTEILVNEGILDPVASDNSTHDEMITIANYRSRIEEAIRLLSSWVCEVRPGKRDMIGFGGTDHLFQTPGHPASEMPIADPIYTYLPCSLSCQVTRPSIIAWIASRRRCHPSWRS